MSDEVAVDASLAVAWVVAEPLTAEARLLLLQWQRDGVRRVVPSWFACEVANALYKRVLRREIVLERAKASLVGLLSDVVVLDVEPALSTRALELAAAFGRSTSYDAHYLALAEHHGCELWTADEKFWNAVKGTFKRVRWVGEVVV